jgi:hypothetical protein
MEWEKVEMVVVVMDGHAAVEEEQWGDVETVGDGHVVVEEKMDEMVAKVVEGVRVAVEVEVNEVVVEIRRNEVVEG